MKNNNYNAKQVINAICAIVEFNDGKFEDAIEIGEIITYLDDTEQAIDANDVGLFNRNIKMMQGK